MEKTNIVTQIAESLLATIRSERERGQTRCVARQHLSITAHNKDLDPGSVLRKTYEYFVEHQDDHNLDEVLFVEKSYNSNFGISKAFELIIVSDRTV